MFRNIQVENNTLRERVEELEQQQQLNMQNTHGTAANEIIDELQRELERLSKDNHRLEGLLQQSRRQTTELLLSPQTHRTAGQSDIGGRDIMNREGEIERLSEELAWHAKLHLFAEKERLRLLDLLEFAGTEGKVVGREYGVLREKLSRISLKDAAAAAGNGSGSGSVVSDGSSGKCLI
jgi:predicted RNase H-like nuclease (RuvC/YqgF family)